MRPHRGGARARIAPFLRGRFLSGCSGPSIWRSRSPGGARVFALPPPPPCPSDFGRAVLSTFKGWGRVLVEWDSPLAERSPPGNSFLLHQAFVPSPCVGDLCGPAPRPLRGRGRPAWLPTASILPPHRPLTEHVLGARRCKGIRLLGSASPFPPDCVCASLLPTPLPVTQHPTSDPEGVAGMGVRSREASQPFSRLSPVRGRAETAVTERERGPRPGWGEGEEVCVGGWYL